MNRNEILKIAKKERKYKRWRKSNAIGRIITGIMALFIIIITVSVCTCYKKP